MSREKGKVAEREAAALIRDAWGIDAARGRQYAGHPDAPDVTSALRGVFLEVKRRESGNVGAWLAEALAECGDAVPVVLHRRSRSPWLLTIYAEHLPSLAAALAHAQRRENGAGRDGATGPQRDGWSK